MDTLTILTRLGCAVLCGLILGIDRELKEKPLGLRAFTLVCLGAAGFSLLAHQFAELALTDESGIKIDPTRAIQGIVSGIGFIGAGAIIQSSDSIKGTATGAGIWVAGAVGVACGYGMYSTALIITAFSFMTLTALEIFSKYLHRHK